MPAPGTSRLPAYKAQIEPKLEYWYKRFHGNLDRPANHRRRRVKPAQATLFPPATFTIAPAPTPPEIVHQVIYHHARPDQAEP